METLSFFDIMPEEETIFFLDEPSRCYEKAQAVETEFRDSMESRLEKGYLCQSSRRSCREWILYLIAAEQAACYFVFAGWTAKAACEQGAGECTGTAGGVL